jgi:hypothetical protein
VGDKVSVNGSMITVATIADNGTGTPSGSFSYTGVVASGDVKVNKMSSGEIALALRRERADMAFAETQAAKGLEKAIEEEAARKLEEERLEELREKEEAERKRQSEIDGARAKLAAAVDESARTDDNAEAFATALATTIDEMDAAPAHVLEALKDDIAAAQVLLDKLKEVQTEKGRQRLRDERIAAAKSKIAALVKDVENDLEALRRHIDAINNDHGDDNIKADLESELAEASAVVSFRDKQIAKIAAALQAACNDTSSDDQYAAMKGALQAFQECRPKPMGAENDALEDRAQVLLIKLEEIYKLKQLLLSLDQKAIAEVKSMNEPLTEIKAIMKSVFLLLGTARRDLKDWKAIRVQLGKTGKESLRRRITNFTTDTVTPDTVERAAKLIDGTDLKKVQSVSPVVAMFYAFARGCLTMLETKDATEEEDGDGAWF